MGMRFRRSVKIAPGVKINFSKGSIGMSVGPKGAHVSVNSKGQTSKSIGVPGTGMSYVERGKVSSGGKSNKRRSADPQQEYAAPKKKRGKKIVGYILIAIGVLGGIGCITPKVSYEGLLGGLIFIGIGVLLVRSKPKNVVEKSTENYYFESEPADQPVQQPANHPVKQEMYPNVEYEDTYESHQSKLPITSEAGKTYAQAVFLNWANGMSISKSSPGFLKYDFNILDAKMYYNKMISEGYLEKADAETSLSKHTVEDLKPILESLDLKKTGKKADLIKRILDAADQEKLDEILSNSDIYVLSDKGKKFLEDHADYVVLYSHRWWEISLDEYEEAKAKIPFTGSAYDTIWAILDRRRLEGYSEHSWRFKSDTRHMADILFEQGKYAEAIDQYCLVEYYSLNENLDGLEYYKDDSIEDLKEEYIEPNVSAEVMGKLYEKKDFYNHDEVAKFMAQWPISKSIITIPEFLNMVETSFETGSYSMEPYKDIMFKRYLKLCGK